jgi:purine-binding chemotaxis protein CheW
MAGVARNVGMKAGERTLCTCRVGALDLGIDVEHVQEVLRGQEMTRLPLASDAVRGIINLRGRIVPVVDLGRCFALEPMDGEAGAGRASIVVRTPEAIVSLLVDEVGDVLPVSEAAFERAPDTMRASARELIHGVFKLHDRLLLELDLGRVLQSAYS